MRVAPSRHIAAGGVAGDRALTSEQAGTQLYLEIPDRRLLRFGEGADVVIGVADIVLQLRRHFAPGRLDLLPRQDHVLPA